MAADPCVYKDVGEEHVFLSVYVDDIIVVAQSNEKMALVKNKVAKCFDI